MAAASNMRGGIAAESTPRRLGAAFDWVCETATHQRKGLVGNETAALPDKSNRMGDRHRKK